MRLRQFDSLSPDIESQAILEPMKPLVCKWPTLRQWVFTVYWTLVTLIVVFFVYLVAVRCGFHFFQEPEEMRMRIDPDEEIAGEGMAFSALMSLVFTIWIRRWDKELFWIGLSIFAGWVIGSALLFPAIN
jgi:hypothetical protein